MRTIFVVGQWALVIVIAFALHWYFGPRKGSEPLGSGDPTEAAATIDSSQTSHPGGRVAVADAPSQSAEALLADHSPVVVAASRSAVNFENLPDIDQNWVLSEATNAYRVGRIKREDLTVFVDQLSSARILKVLERSEPIVRAEEANPFDNEFE